MLNAHDLDITRERGLNINGEPRLPVVAAAGAGSRVSEGAAGVAAGAFYPRRPRKSNQTYQGIHVQVRVGYKDKSKACCRFLGQIHASHPAKLRTVENAESE